MFYFPVNKGSFDLSNVGTNSHNGELVSIRNRFDIKFNINAFVDINIKLMGSIKEPILLYKDLSQVVDCGIGPYINLRWIGPVTNDTHFHISPTVEPQYDGYWHISII